MRPRAFWRYLGALGLLLQSLAALFWWAILLLDAGTRAYFRPINAPDATLLAFALPDALLFIGAGLWAARELVVRPKRALVPLALHVGGATYGALFCLMQWFLTHQAGLAALFMAPCLCWGPWLLWKLGRDSKS